MIHPKILQHQSTRCNWKKITKGGVAFSAKYTFVLTTLKKCIFFTLYEHGEIPWDQGIVCK